MFSDREAHNNVQRNYSHKNIKTQKLEIKKNVKRARSYERRFTKKVGRESKRKQTKRDVNVRQSLAVNV